MFDVHDYSDIINISKPKSKHLPMTKLQRAAQFAPFAALKGYEESIVEAGRIVDKKIELSEEQKDTLSFKLTYLKEHILEQNEIEVIYFLKDKSKNGGKYYIKNGILRRIDDVERKLEFQDRIKISINDIVQIKSDCFNQFELD